MYVYGGMGRVARNRVVKNLIVFTIAMLTLSLTNSIYACTIFSATDGETVLVGNNEDFYYNYDSLMWIVKGNDEYSRICFANSTYVQGGMNEKGLFYDGATCPSTTVPYSSDKPSLSMDLGEVVLSKCATVEEAIEMLRNYNIPKNFGDHILFADESGNSAVVEWVNNEMIVVLKDGTYQIATNFFLSNRNLGGYPCTRYIKVKDILDKENSVTVDGFVSALKVAAQKWSGGGTKYSNIYELNNKEVYIFNKGEFSQVYTINLIEVIRKMKSGEKTMYNLDDLKYSQVGKEDELINEVAAKGEPSTNTENKAIINETIASTEEQAGDINIESNITVTEKRESEKKGVIFVIGATGIILLLRFLYKRTISQNRNA